VQYAHWEESQKDFRRARSVWERAIDVDYTITNFWLKVGWLTDCYNPCSQVMLLRLPLYRDLAACSLMRACLNNINSNYGSRYGSCIVRQHLQGPQRAVQWIVRFTCADVMLCQAGHPGSVQSLLRQWVLLPLPPLLCTLFFFVVC
jgi:hypothetical protein